MDRIQSVTLKYYWVSKILYLVKERNFVIIFPCNLSFINPNAFLFFPVGNGLLVLQLFQHHLEYLYKHLLF